MEKTQHMNRVPLRDEDYDITDMLQYQKLDIGRLILRITIGGLMLFHGMNKLMYGTEQVERLLTNVGLPPLFSFGVFVGEILGPVMLILGYKVRLGAFFIAVDMLIAVLLVHAAQLAQISDSGGWMVELNALYFLGAIAIMFLGSGHMAISKGKGFLD